MQSRGEVSSLHQSRACRTRLHGTEDTLRAPAVAITGIRLFSNLPYASPHLVHAAPTDAKSHTSRDTT
jgi:hypothetical protein